MHGLLAVAATVPHMICTVAIAEGSLEVKIPIYGQVKGSKEIIREVDKWTDGRTDRQPARQAGRQAARQKDRLMKTEREREGWRDREREYARPFMHHNNCRVGFRSLKLPPLPCGVLLALCLVMTLKVFSTTVPIAKTRHHNNVTRSDKMSQAQMQ